MGDLLQFPKSERERRVDALCEALVKHPGPRELITFEAHASAIVVRVAGVELWLTSEEAREVAEDLIETAADADALAEKLGVPRG